MKKIIASILAALFALTLCCSALAEEIPVIGINQYGEHGSLDNCRSAWPTPAWSKGRTSRSITRTRALTTPSPRRSPRTSPRRTSR